MRTLTEEALQGTVTFSRNLTVGEQVPAAELRTLQRLCDSAGVPSSTAQLLTKQLRAAAGQIEDKSQAPLMPRTVDELSWLGVSADVVKRLKPFVTLLPQRTPVNLNTAPRELISGRRAGDGHEVAPVAGLADSKVLTLDAAQLGAYIGSLTAARLDLVIAAHAAVVVFEQEVQHGWRS